MSKKILACSLLWAASTSLSAQQSATINLNADQGKTIIPKEIYGQFAEHLGTCIYGGLWVGENSAIPNTNGYRTDVFNALKDLKVPVLRWPGGCFADEYHWMDGIGPKANRPKMVNNNWGGTIEDNSFGTHEFLNLCEMLGCEPYISGNVGSGSVEELAKWVEYMTSEGDSPMARLRRANGRDHAWKVKYLGVGNESWGCGGNMRPEFYSDLYRRYATYCRNYDDNRLFKIASGASDYDYTWTRVLMEQVGSQMNGLSLHYYTVSGWTGSKGAATQFNKDDYYWTIGKCREIEDVIKRHCAIMDSYDPQKQVALMLDEWGTWWDEEPGTIRGHLYQQNTLRDAFVASTTFDIFHKYTDRLKMANIAQIVNVLQSMILTNDKGGMVLTPTYYVFKMYNVHQDATYLPLSINCKEMPVRDNRTVPMLSATASKDQAGKIHISLSNIDADNEQTVTVALGDIKATKAVGEILTAKNLTDYNTFEQPDMVKPAAFTNAKIAKGVLTIKMPAKSIVTVELQ
ncbi:MAG: alpha-N-arabinofuranosidase [Prevotellaceae bacterium]|jgi:alpha-N-arabinofuranosidase|nr:alpha-N-arabinofuranosidase [Prevotellaceae bacterium]